MRLGIAVSIAAALTATALAPQLASASTASGGSMVIQPTRTPTTPGGGAFSGVSCHSATRCIAVGAGAESPGLAFADKWNGTKWIALTVAEPSGVTRSGLEGVSCSSSTACTAVGYYFNGSGSELTLGERWNGTSWSIQSTPSPGSYGPELLGVSCPTATDCTAVGTYQAVVGGPNVTLAERWSGGTWKVQTTPNPTAAGHWTQLSSVSCSSASACTAVGYYLDSSNSEVMVAERWNGKVWAIQSTPSPAGALQTVLAGVSCASSTDCTAVGTQITSTANLTLAEGWDGTAWTTQTSPSGLAGEFAAVSCPTTGACTATGMYQVVNGTFVTLAEQWNGATWTIESTPSPSNRKSADLTGVSCVSASMCEAVGFSTASLGHDYTLAVGNA
jgi:hypothetical protein